MPLCSPLQAPQPPLTPSGSSKHWCPARKPLVAVAIASSCDKSWRFSWQQGRFRQSCSWINMRFTPDSALGQPDYPTAASCGWVTAPQSHLRLLHRKQTQVFACRGNPTWAQEAGAQPMQKTTGFRRAEGWTAWWKARLPRKIWLDLLPGLQNENDSTSLLLSLGTFLNLLSFSSLLVAQEQRERKNLGDRSAVRVNVDG